MLKGFLYAICEKYGADAAFEFCHMVYKEGDRIKNFTNTVLKIFKIEGNDAETIAKWFTIFGELCEFEYTWLERSKTIHTAKITKCPWELAHKDLSGWSVIFKNYVAKAINPKATIERPKAMCDGDPYCEYVFKIEE